MKIFNKDEWKKIKLGNICEVISGEWGTEVNENSKNKFDRTPLAPASFNCSSFLKY